MARNLKSRSRKAGLPPGSLIHIGERKSETARITLFRYGERAVSEEAVTDPAQVAPPAGNGVLWVNLVGVHDPAVFEKLATGFGLHPLVQEDVLNTDQRTKLEDYGDYLYIVLKGLSGNGEGIVSEQVSIVLGPSWVISVQEGDSPLFHPVIERLRTGRGHIRKLGSDYLVYSLLDAVVDNYFLVLERFGDRIDALQNEVVAHPVPAALGTLHQLRHEIIGLRRSVWPLRDVADTLAHGASNLVKQETWIYLRDVHDHTIHVIETIETYRDMMSGMLDIYLSSLSHRMNEVMKVLTIIATIFMPLTFIAGVYGMNFKNMPELGWEWGYPAALTLMFSVAVGMVAYFLRKKWI
jgi:magnesium transporter